MNTVLMLLGLEKVYKVTFSTTDSKLKNIQFFRGSTWKVVELAFKEADRKSEAEHTRWTIIDIVRV